MDPSVKIKKQESKIKSNVIALLLILEVKINFSLGFDNTDYQTKKL